VPMIECFTRLRVCLGRLSDWIAFSAGTARLLRRLRPQVEWGSTSDSRGVTRPPLRGKTSATLGNCKSQTTLARYGNSAATSASLDSGRFQAQIPPALSFSPGDDSPLFSASLMQPLESLRRQHHALLPPYLLRLPPSTELASEGAQRFLIERVLRDVAISPYTAERGYERTFWRRIVAELERGVSGLHVQDDSCVSMHTILGRSYEGDRGGRSVL